MKRGASDVFPLIMHRVQDGDGIEPAAQSLPGTQCSQMLCGMLRSRTFAEIDWVRQRLSSFITIISSYEGLLLDPSANSGT